MAASASGFAAAVLLAAAVSALAASAMAAPGRRHRRSDPPPIDQLSDWNKIHEKSICPAALKYDDNFHVMQVWCADDVEGKRFAARDKTYVCRSVRYSVPFAGSDVDIRAGCVARLDDAVILQAEPFPGDQ